MRSDAELLEAYVTEDSEDAFRELVKRNTDLVYSAALRQVGQDADLARDAAQRVFTDLAKKANQLTDHPTLTGWLFKSTYFAARTILRTERRRTLKAADFPLVMAELNPGPDWDRLRNVLDRAMLELGTLDREAVLLRFFSKNSFNQIGATLQLSDDAARKRVDRALGKLHAILANRGITSSTAGLAIALSQHAVSAAPGGLATSLTAAALISTSVTPAVTALFFTFMNTTKATLVIASIAAFSVGSALYQMHLAKLSQSTLEASVADRNALEAELHKTQQQLRQRATKPLVSQATSSTPNASVLTATNPKTSPVSTVNEDALDRLVVGNPELQQLYVKQQTIRLKENYGLLYHNLGLNPAQISAFEKVMSDYAEATIDIPISSLAQGLKKSDPAVKDLLTQAAQDRDQALRTVLGDQGLSEFQHFKQSEGARAVASVLAGELYYTDSPLTADNVNRLTAIIQSTQDKTSSALNWDAIITQAQGVLPSLQLETLQRKKEQIDLGAKIYKLTESARSPGAR